MSAQANVPGSRPTGQQYGMGLPGQAGPGRGSASSAMSQQRPVQGAGGPFSAAASRAAPAASIAGGSGVSNARGTTATASPMPGNDALSSLFGTKGTSMPPGLGASSAAASGTAAFSAPPGLFGGAQQKAGDASDAATAGAAVASMPSVPPDAYGMGGLLTLLKAGDRDIPALALGTDLSAPGVNISAPSTSSHPLHALFASPWAKEATPLEPHWTLPASYRMPQPALKTGHLAKFDVTTLLYIFYAMPRDILQAYAAQELYARDWRYHRDLKLWFKSESGAGAGAGKAAQSAVTWSYFDLPSWERRAYTGPVGSLAAGFLSEEDCKVKAGGPAPT